jgi:hypothetical protein
VLDSVQSGLPILQREAELDGVDAVLALVEQFQRFTPYLPPFADEKPLFHVKPDML